MGTSLKRPARLAGFAGRHPLFVASLASAVCVALAGIDARLGFAGCAVIALAGWFADWRRVLATIACCALATALFVVRTSSRDADGRRLLDLGGGRVEARLLENGKGGNGLWAARARLSTGEKVYWLGRGETPLAGAGITAHVAFEPLPEPRNPGEFNHAAWLRLLGTTVVAEARGGTVRMDKWATFAANCRSGFREAVITGLDPLSMEARVILAIVIGEQPGDSDELVGVFRNSGTLHLFSVSGMHVAMVASIGWLCLRFMGVPRRWAILCLIFLVFGYSWISGNSAPALRAAWMSAVFLSAFVFRRRPDLLNTLGVVLLGMILWDGNLIFQPGVQLSYGVVAVIAIGTAWVARLFRWMEEPELYLPTRLMNRWQRASLRARQYFARSTAVSTAAWAGSTPLTIAHFGLVTPVSILANVPLAGIVYCLMCASLLAAAIFPFSRSAAGVVNRGNAAIAWSCTATADFFSRFPGAYFHTRAAGEAFLLVYDLEHGAGGSVFSGAGDGAVLLDCGDRHGFKRRMVSSLRELGVTPDSVVISHPDGGHLGGASAVWEAFPVEQALLPVERARSPDFRAWLADAPKAGIRMVPMAEMEYRLPDGARLEVLHVPEPRAQNIPADDRVAIFRIHWRGWKLLMTSDAGPRIEDALISAGKEIQADVIVAGRHRSDPGPGDAFLERVKPRAIVASNDEFPPQERLPTRQVDAWRAQGIEVIDQGRAGGVTFRVDKAGNLRIEGFADRSVVTLTR